MIINKISSEKFKKYGRVLKGYHFDKLINELEQASLVNSVIYVPSIDSLEELDEAKELEKGVFGGMPIQIGYCLGSNSKLNALEYHMSSEVNIAVTDMILMLGLRQDIEEDGTYATSNVEAFFIPKGAGVELYATTLHYAPCNAEKQGFKCIVILPKGTNTDYNIDTSDMLDEKMLFAKNKWLLSHKDANINNSFCGLKGDNITAAVMSVHNESDLQIMANKIRQGIITSIFYAKSGHPGGSLSAADIFTCLYFDEMNIEPVNPKANNRDRFVLSKGHTAPGYYSALAYRGFFPIEDLKSLRHLGSYLQGHPDMKHIPGVDMSSGSLGQGISAAVGMALSAKLTNSVYRVYTLLGDGELQEGQVWEAAMFAGARKLDNLVVIVDNNNLQIDGEIGEVCSPYPITDKFKAFNFHVINVNGHNFKQLKEAFLEAKNIKDKPTAIIAGTVKGKGISFMENNVNWHGKAPSDNEYETAMNELRKEGELLCQM